MITTEEMESKLQEIEELQNKVADIMYSKNWFVKTFLFRKALKLHKLAHTKLEELLDDIFPE